MPFETCLGYQQNSIAHTKCGSTVDKEKAIADCTVGSIIFRPLQNTHAFIALELNSVFTSPKCRF